MRAHLTPTPWRRAWSALASFDPGRRQLRITVVTVAAMLASYGSALALEHAEGLGLGVVVLAVVLSLTLSRNYHARHGREWLTGLVVLSALALAASEVGSLLVSHADLGDGLFVLAISGSIWIRRFGPRFARAGTLVALPFVALLVAPAVPGAGREHTLWAAVVGAIAYLWVSGARTLAERTGFVAALPGGPASPAATRAGARRLAASSRMALQMGVALAISFALGRALFGVHWSWLVMTAFIVTSGNRGRADVVYKSGLRVAGAAAGTVAATLLAGAFAPHDTATVVVIFVVLGIASWLRTLSYAYWAAAITSVLALLYGYFGESGSRVLPQRLEGIVLGALIAVAVSWLLLPVRTTDVLRRRLADLLAALSELLGALSADRAELAGRARSFERALDALDEIARPLHAHRLLSARLREGAHVADTIDAARRCRAPVASIVELASAAPALPEPGELAAQRRRVSARITAARRALAGRHEDVEAPPRAGRQARAGEIATSAGRDGELQRIASSLAELDAALAELAVSARAVASTRPRPARNG